MPIHESFQPIYDFYIKKYGKENGERRFYKFMRSRGIDESKPMSEQKAKMKKLDLTMLEKGIWYED